MAKKGKYIKEYVLEFFLIFFAVTLGFFADNYRRYLDDRSQEKEYIESMVEDLRADSAFLELCINKLINHHLTWLDSTVNLLQMRNLNGQDRQVYQAFIIGTGWTYNYHLTDRTLSQLHSDGFQLIRNKNAANAISHLEHQYKFYLPTTTLLENFQNDIDLSAYAFADKAVIDKIAATAFQNFSDSSAVQLRLSDIPESATISLRNTEGIKSYVSKLEKYSFFLQYAVKSWQVLLLKEIKKTMSVLSSEYNLKK